MVCPSGNPTMGIRLRKKYSKAQRSALSTPMVVSRIRFSKELVAVALPVTARYLRSRGPMSSDNSLTPHRTMTVQAAPEGNGAENARSHSCTNSHSLNLCPYHSCPQPMIAPDCGVSGSTIRSGEASYVRLLLREQWRNDQTESASLGPRGAAGCPIPEATADALFADLYELC